MKNLFMKKFILFSILIIAVNFISCKKENTKVDVIATDVCVAVSYSNDIKKIIDKSCNSSGCHASQSPILVNYAQVKAQVDNGKIKKEVITNQTMPQGSSLTSNELGLIQCWIDNGAQE